MYKNILNTTKKNRVFTPKETHDFLKHLPRNYLEQTQKILQDAVNAGVIDTVYSKRQIQRVKKSEAFNEDILVALLLVGEENYKKMRKYYKIKKAVSVK